MNCLPDVNVWLALTTRRHAQHRVAARWAETVDAEAMLFCRITQMALLRLLTNRSVMGDDTLEAGDAWVVYDRLAADDRVGYLAEPAGFEQEWRTVSAQGGPAGASWTDSYLLALARTAGIRLVTFDRALAARGHREAILL